MVPNRRSEALPCLVALSHSALEILHGDLLLHHTEMLPANDEICSLEPRLLGWLQYSFGWLEQIRIEGKNGDLPKSNVYTVTIRLDKIGPGLLW